MLIVDEAHHIVSEVNMRILWDVCYFVIFSYSADSLQVRSFVPAMILQVPVVSYGHTGAGLLSTGTAMYV